jgi:hypothetical protein
VNLREDLLQIAQIMSDTCDGKYSDFCAKMVSADLMHVANVERQGQQTVKAASISSGSNVQALSTEVLVHELQRRHNFNGSESSKCVGKRHFEDTEESDCNNACEDDDIVNPKVTCIHFLLRCHNTITLHITYTYSMS